MNIVKTLGPTTTDSYRATKHWAAKQDEDYCIQTYKSIENIFDNLNEDDYIIMPVGYTNRNSSELSSWVDFHFRYMNCLNLKEVFVLDTLSMVLLENTSFSKNKAILQSSTYQIFKSYISDPIQIDFASSKSEALTEFLNQSYRYVVCSLEDLLKREVDMTTLKHLKTIRPKMIWVVYSIKNEKL